MLCVKAFIFKPAIDPIILEVKKGVKLLFLLFGIIKYFLIIIVPY